MTQMSNMEVYLRVRMIHILLCTRETCWRTPCFLYSHLGCGVPLLLHFSLTRLCPFTSSQQHSPLPLSFFLLSLLFFAALLSLFFPTPHPPPPSSCLPSLFFVLSFSFSCSFSPPSSSVSFLPFFLALLLFASSPFTTSPLTRLASSLLPFRCHLIALSCERLPHYIVTSFPLPYMLPLFRVFLTLMRVFERHCPAHFMSVQHHMQVTMPI